MSGPSVRELARVADPLLRRVAGMARRLTISATTSPIWKLLGVRGLDGSTERIDAEAFSGVGFYARPRSSGGTPEAIVLHVGDARVPVVVACRDERTLAAVRDALGGIDAGDAVMYAPDGSAVVHVTGGEVRVKTPSGTAVALATKADLDAVVTYIKKQFAASTGHIHATPSGPTTTITEGTVAGGTCPSPAGTSVLKGQ